MASLPTTRGPAKPSSLSGQRHPLSVATPFIAPLRMWHLTSLDAPTVAIVWALAFAWTAHIQPPLWILAVLGLEAWAFYIADRLLDARPAYTCTRDFSKLRARHHFHWQHRQVFLIIAITSASIALCLVLSYMPSAARVRGSLLASTALAYVALVHMPPPNPRRIPKELLVGVLFTVACALPSWSRTAIPGPFSLGSILVVPSFAALAWLNCHAIENWESREAKSTPSQPIQPAIPPNSTSRTVGIPAIALATLLAFFSVTSGDSRVAAILLAAALSATLLALLDRFRTRLAPITLRAAADLALLTPILLPPALLLATKWRL